MRMFFRTSTTTALASLLGQAPGFFVPMVAAAMFGASAASDQAFMALAVATFITTTLSGATQFAAVPFFVAARHSHAGAAFLRQTTWLVVVAAALLCAAAVLSFDHIGPTSTAGYALARRYFVALWPFTVAAAVSSLFVGALNATSDYVSAALSPAWRWLTVLACVLIFGNTAGVVALIAGHTLGEAVRVWRLWTTVKSRYVLDASSAGARTPNLFGVLRAASGQLLASGLVAVVPVVDRAIAAGLPNGSISLLEYADRIWQIPVGFATSGLLVVLLTKWSHDAVASDRIRIMAAQTRKGAFLAVCLAIGPSLTVAWQRHWCTQLLYGYGSLSPGDLSLLADALGYYAVGIPTYVAALVYTRAFLAMQRSEWMAVIAACELLFKLGINPIFLRVLGLPGLAAATSAMYGTGLLMLIVTFEMILRRYDRRAASGLSE
jgi:putative peptidoglycan lipid II flippase